MVDLKRKACLYCGTYFERHPKVEHPVAAVRSLVSTGDLHCCQTCAEMLTSEQTLDTLMRLAVPRANEPRLACLYIVDAMARMLMSLRPDLDAMSLSDWLIEHRDHLTDAEANAALTLITLHGECS